MYIRLFYLWQQPRVRKVAREFAFWEGRDVTVMSLHAGENLVLEQQHDSSKQRFELANFSTRFPTPLLRRETEKIYVALFVL